MIAMGYGIQESKGDIVIMDFTESLIFQKQGTDWHCKNCCLYMSTRKKEKIPFMSFHILAVLVHVHLKLPKDMRKLSREMD